MKITAKNNYLRIAPRKVRTVCDLIRDMEIEEALVQLQRANKKAAKPIKKLLESAIANADHNYGISREDLDLKEIKADKGPTLKRWQPRAFGRTTSIDKRTSHVTVHLTPKEGVKAEKKEEQAKEVETKQEAPTKKKKSFSQKKDQQQESKKKDSKEKRESFFRRKSI